MIDGFTGGSCGVTFPSFRELSTPLVRQEKTDTEHIIGRSVSPCETHLSGETERIKKGRERMI